jgi:hypothetical protein
VIVFGPLQRGPIRLAHADWIGSPIEMRLTAVGVGWSPNQQSAIANRIRQSAIPIQITLLCISTPDRYDRLIDGR